jgi:hypothetical protein
VKTKNPQTDPSAWGFPFLILTLLWRQQPTPGLETHVFVVAGLLALRITLLTAPSHPLLMDSGVVAAFVPDHSGGSAPDFNGIPY